MSNNMNKWNGDYEYKGYYIINHAPKDWHIEPMWDNVEAIEQFNNRVCVPVLKTIAEAKKWIRENGNKYNESDFINH